MNIFESSYNPLLRHQSNQPLKVEAIPLSALAKDTTSELDDQSPHQPF